MSEGLTFENPFKTQANGLQDAREFVTNMWA